MTSQSLISEWTKKSRVADEFSEEMKEAFKCIYPAKTDFEAAFSEIYESILIGLNEDDQINYFISSQYLNQRNKRAEVLKHTRIRNAIVRKIERFYNKLCIVMYHDEPAAVETNISMRGIFRTVDEEDLEDLEDKVEPVSSKAVGDEVEPKRETLKMMKEFVPDSVMNELSDKLASMNAADAYTDAIIPYVDEAEKPDDIFSTEEMVEINATVNKELEEKEKVFCPVCLVAITTMNEEVIECYSNNHPIHVMCRWNLAKRKGHKCPSCREDIEEDGGREFCRNYGIRHATIIIKSPTTPTLTITTRSRSSKKVEL